MENSNSFPERELSRGLRKTSTILVYKMSRINDMYNHRCNEHSDINEHLPTLRKYTLECTHVTECGVRGACSAYAFADGLRNRPETKMVQIDIEYHPRMGEFIEISKSEGLNVELNIVSDIKCKREQTDLLFIDTWHVYGHLKREFEYWHSYVNKYIILHDTTVDEFLGESIRCGMDIERQSAEYGIPIDEIKKGLWPAVEEFLAEHPEWTLHERFTNNNGLTVLKRTT
jgi:cephalosporin hydroxylase